MIKDKKVIFSKLETEVRLNLPEWAIEKLNTLPSHFPNIDERMKTVIEFSRLNFRNKTGGPFAAGIFERDTGKLVVIGVNRVVPSNCSSAHAEVMAISLAQKILGTFDLGGGDMPSYQIVVNWRPCSMCYGALLWSGIRSVVIAGSGSELEEITGFDEGPIHPEWKDELNKRGIELVENILHDEAVEVFKEFKNSGALVYNGRQG